MAHVLGTAGGSSNSAQLSMNRFWKEHLCEAVPLLELPLDKTRPNTRTCFEFGSARWALTARTSAELEQLSADLSVPLPAVVFAAYLSFLSHVSRQDNVTVGCNPESLLTSTRQGQQPVTLSSSSKASQHADSYEPEPSCDSITTPATVDVKRLVPFCKAFDVEAQSLHSLAADIAAGLSQLAPYAQTTIQEICQATGTAISKTYHPIYQAGFLLLPSHFSTEDVTAAAAATMHPLAASAGAISASLIRSALCHRGSSFSSSFSTSFSTAGLQGDGHGDSLAPLDLLLVLQDSSSGCAGPAGQPMRAGQPMPAQDSSSGGGGLRGVLAYSPDVLEPHMMDLLAEHFQVFLAAASANPGAPLGSLAMMSAVEQQQVLQAFNDTGLPPAMPSPQGHLVHHQFMRQAAAHPDAPCLIFEGQVLTYSQVDAASNKLAHHLLTCCRVREGDVVGLLLQRSHMLLAMLGILKAGGAYLPLDPGHPPSRTAFIVADAGLKVVVCSEDLAQLLPAPSDALAHVVLPEEGLGPVVSSSPEHSPGLLGRIDDLVYVIYTSGSTGNPKGVMVQHSNLVNFLAWEQAAFAHTPCDVFLQKTPTNFDVSIEELWTPLVTGAPLVIAKPNGHKDTAYLLELIERHGVTNLSMVPSQISMLLMELEAEPAPCPSLKRILSAGEALTTSLANQVARVLPHVDLVNAYGPTEATVYITHHTFDKSEKHMRPTISIGKPLTNSKCYVVDRKIRLCPIGVPGELVVSGPQITRGYLNLPDKTAAVFEPNPYACGPGTCTEVMYHTGDLARWLPCGRIKCMGRTDHQMKLCGYRIELQEVESALSEQPGITAAVCGILKDPQSQARLVAYAEPSAGAAAKPCDRLALHASLSRRLPSYMIPEVLVVMEALPRLSNEKLNRKALPEPDWGKDALVATAAAAAGGSSGSSGGVVAYSAQQLAADSVLDAVVVAWGKALGVDPLTLGPKSDFMGLGGNSLQAGLMAAAVRRALQLPRLSGLLIYSQSQLGGFAAEVKKQEKAVGGPGSAAAAAGAAGAALGSAMGGKGTCATTVNAYAVDDADTTASRDMMPGGGCGSNGGSSECIGTSSSIRSRCLPLWFASLLQLFAAAACSGLQLVFNLAPLLTVQIVMAHLNEWTALAFIPVAKVLLLLSAVCLHVGAKWLLVGRYTPGVYPIYGLHYVAWWIERLLFKNVQALLLPFIRGTALHNAYFRLLGACIAPDAVLDAEDVSEYDLIDIQQGAFVGGNAVISPGNKMAISNKQGLEAASYPYGTFTHCKITVGTGAVVSGLCVLAGPNASVPPGAVLPPNSSSTDAEALRKGQQIGAEGLRLAEKPMGVLPALAALLMVVLFESLMLVPATVGVMLLWDKLAVSTQSIGDTAWGMLSCWLVPELERTRRQQQQCTEIMYGELVSIAAFGPMLLLSNLLLLFVFVVPLKWLVLGKVTEAKLTSRSAFRQWSIHAFVVVQRSPHVRLATTMIQGTELFNVFLRMIGYKIGRQCWLSNNNMSLVTPDLVTFGDAVSMGSDCHFYNATPTAAGTITFSDGVDVGHQATLFPGSVLKPGCVLGAKSNVMEGEVLPSGAIRLGTALLKGGKDIESSGDASNPLDTANGNRALLDTRIVSTTRYTLCNIALLLGNLVIIPLSLSLLSMPLFALVLVAVYEGSGMMVAPAVLMGFALNCMVNMAWLGVLRRLLLPSTAGVHPFYSSFFVRWNLWTGPFGLATMAFTPYFGSQIIIWFYRALGTSIGSGCCIGGGYSAEPDSFTIGDDCVLESYSAASNHTIERRKVTISTIKLADRVTLGVYGVMFPDTEAEAGAVLDHCSVLLKGERAMAGTQWKGIPAEPVW